jgi:hypothetical protein
MVRGKGQKIEESGGAKCGPIPTDFVGRSAPIRPLRRIAAGITVDRPGHERSYLRHVVDKRP